MMPPGRVNAGGSRRGNLAAVIRTWIEFPGADGKGVKMPGLSLPPSVSGSQTGRAGRGPGLFVPAVSDPKFRK